MIKKAAIATPVRGVNLAMRGYIYMKGLQLIGNTSDASFFFL